MSLPRYPAYKDSGCEWIRSIPSHWNVCKFRHSFCESNEKIDEQVVGPMLSVSGYRGIEVKEYDDDNRRRSDDELEGYRIVRPGQLVVNTMWLNYAGLGVSDYEGHVSPAYRSYEIKRSLHKRFVHHMMRSPEFVKGYTKFLTGIRPNSLQMSRENLMEFKLVEPPFEEQSDIAAFLDRETAKIDALIAEQEKLLALLAEKRQATISHAVTKGLNPDAPMKDSGIAWLGEVPAHWEIKKIKHELARDGYKAGPFGSSLITSELLDEGEILVLNPEHVARQTTRLPSNQFLPSTRIPEMSQFFVKADDVVFPIVGSLGRAMVMDGSSPAILNQRLARMTPEKDTLSPVYLKLLLTDVDFYKRLDEAESKGAIISHITKDSLINRPMALPPIEEQIKILAWLEDELIKLERIQVTTRLAIELIRERRSALIAAAVTGQIDVRGTVEAQAA